MTEKSMRLKDELNTVTFQVVPDANKVEIRQAVEAIFNVKVSSVRTSTVEGKLKRMGRHQGRRPSWKKAVVTLAPGHKIELVEGV
jgi:large subunit ribosomal protein L23